VNALLQGKFGDTGTELPGSGSTRRSEWRACSTRRRISTSPKDETRQTLGVYGLGPGFYLVLPILGPSDARDAVGLVGDTYLDPLTYLLSFEWSLGPIRPSQPT